MTRANTGESMPEEAEPQTNPGAPPNQEAPPPITPNPPDATAGGSSQSGTPNPPPPAPPAEKTFTQAEVDSVITEWLSKQKQRAEDAAAKAKAEAERDAAVKQGEFKALYEKTLAQLEAAEASRKALELAQLQRQASDKVGLPSAFADRLCGETSAELEADARTLCWPRCPNRPCPTSTTRPAAAGRRNPGR